MINLSFHNLRDKTPEPNIPINFFVVSGQANGLEAGSNMYNGVCKYHWTGIDEDGHPNGVDCCYDYESIEDSGVLPGEKVTSEDGSIYIKEIQLYHEDNFPVTIFPFMECDHSIEIIWQYAHIVHYNLAKQCGMSHSRFPTDHFEMLMNDGMIAVDSVDVFEVCNRSGDEYKHADVVFDWQGVKWRVGMSENVTWQDNAWIDGKYADCFIYRVEKID